MLVIELWAHCGSKGTSMQAFTALMGNSGSGSKYSAEIVLELGNILKVELVGHVGGVGIALHFFMSNLAIKNIKD